MPGFGRGNASNAIILPRTIPGCILWFDSIIGAVVQSPTIYGSLLDRSNSTSVICEVDSELDQAVNAFRTLVGLTTGVADIGSSIPVFGANMSFFACLSDTGTSSIALGNALSVGVDASAHVNIAGGVVVGTIAINSGAVRTIATTQANTNGSVYVDGVLDASGSGLSSPAGAQISTFTAGATAKIAEVAVYNRSLSAQEVKLLHNYAIGRWK